MIAALSLRKKKNRRRSCLSFIAMAFAVKFPEVAASLCAQVQKCFEVLKKGAITYLDYLETGE